MIFLMCESDVYDFEVTIFQKDAPKYLPDLEIGKFVIVTGGISVNEKFGRKTILAREMKVVSLSFVREHARKTECFLENIRYDFAKKLALQSQMTQKNDIPQNTSTGDEEDFQEIPERENISTPLENEYIPDEYFVPEEENGVSKYIIPIGSHTPRQVLHDLKSFLEEQPKGNIPIFLLFGEQEIDTKIALGSLEELKKWEKEKL